MELKSRFVASAFMLAMMVLVLGSPSLGQPFAPTGKPAVTELIVLLAATDDAPTPKEAVDALERGQGLAVGLDVGNAKGARLALTHRAGAEARERLLKNPDGPRARLERYVVVEYPATADLDAAMKALAKNPHVLHVEKNFHFSFSVSPNDPLFPQQWGPPMLNLPNAWNRAKGHAFVGFVDVGVETEHPDLRAFPTHLERTITGDDGLLKTVCGYGNGSFEGGNFRPHLSWDFDEGDCNVDERDPLETNVGHGSHVAGIVGATADNSTGVAGVCWNCSLMMSKALRTTASNAADALTFLVDKGVQAVSMSFGIAGIECPADEPNAFGMFCTALSFAEDRDVALFAAPGNDKVDIEFPASDSRVMSMGGIESTGAFWDRADEGGCPLSGTIECGSNYQVTPGSAPQDLVAPAKEVLSTMYGGFDWNAGLGCGDSTHPAFGYGLCTGTSMASPHGAGLAGVLRSINPLLDKSEIRDALIKNADRGHLSVPDPKFGFGVPDLAASADAVLGTTGGQVNANRLAPLFALYSNAAQSHLHTATPQVASAALFDSETPFLTRFTQSPVTPPTTPDLFRFPGAPCFIGPCDNEPRASVYLFTTDSAPFPGAPPLVPLYRMSYDEPWNGNLANRSFFYTTETTGVENFKSVGYELDGIEGYIYSRCTPEPSCIPAGAVRLYRLYHTTRDDYAIFPESEETTFRNAGYISQGSLNDWIGYVYPNVDSDFDDVIDGFETLIGTDPASTDSDCDGLTDGAEVIVYDSDGYGDPLDGNCGNVTIGEVGRVTNLTHVRQTVSLSRSYKNPVVIAQPPSQNGSHTSVVRITNVTANSFTFYIHEAPNMDGSHTTETVSYLVVEAGSFKLPDGTELRAGNLNTSSTVGRRITNQWATVSYGGSFPAAPIVLSQVQTENDPSWVKTRQTSVGTSSFLVGLEKEEVSLLTHPTETVGWVAISPSSGTWSGHPFVASRTGNSVTDAWLPVSFSQNVGSVPHFLAAMSTYDGADNSELRYRSLTGGGVEVRVEEDTTFDTEVAHTTEVIDYLVIGNAGTLEGTGN